jgi:thiol:disulfide interchange protein DsbD
MNYAQLLILVTSILLPTWLAPAPAAAAPAPRPADQVFKLSVAFDDEEGLELNWQIAEGYYLYRDKITVTLSGKALEITTSRGEVKDDPSFGPTEIYRDAAAANVVGDPLPETGILEVTYQGCGENTICYPPITKTIDLATLIVSEPADQRGARQGRLGFVEPVTFTTLAGADETSGRFQLSGGYLSMMLAFASFGLLLSFTPCMFPMIPILSAMLTRSTDGSTGRSLALSSVFVLAISMAYATTGLFAAWWGGNIQVTLQTPLAITVMSLVFAILAASMFGLFELQLPQRMTARLMPSPRRGGTLGGAAVLGFASALIVGPCATPPLAAALIYASQTGDTIRGSLALFALGLGAGLPLIAFGAFGAKALPRSGPWLRRTKQLFGFVFLALAIWMASRVAPPVLVEMAWGALLIGIGAWAGLIDRMIARSDPGLRQLLFAGPGAIIAIYGFFVIVGVSAGLSGPTQPLAWLGLLQTSAAADDPGFQTVTSVPAFDDVLTAGSDDRRPLLIDFSAEWCAECKVMEQTVLANAAVRERLRGFRLVRADMTHFDASAKQLMQRFSVVGPPTLIFLNSAGKEVDAARIVGAVGVDEFLETLTRLQRS